MIDCSNSAMTQIRALFAATVLVSGCGGGGGSAPATSVAATPAAVPAPAAPATVPTPTSTPIAEAPCVTRPGAPVVRIQLFGDSTIWGYDGNASNGSRAATNPEQVLQQLMNAKFTTGATQVTTTAASGTQTIDAIRGLVGAYALPWPGLVNADILVINYGINDKYAGMPPLMYMANLRLMAASVTAKVVFMTPLPVWSSRYPEYLSTSYAPEMRAVAAELRAPVGDASAYALSIENWNSPAFAKDGVHPNGEGYRLITTNVLAPVLDPLVRAVRCR